MYKSEDEMGKERHVSLAFCFVVNVLQNDPHYLHQGQDQSTKCQGAHMVPVM